MDNATTMLHGQCFSKDDVLYFSLLLVVAFFVICLNSGVIVTMATNSSLRTKRNAFLASLTISDLLTGLVAIPLHILCSCYHHSSGDLCLAQAVCFRFIAISTMLNILMITVERYIGIIYPLRYIFILTAPRTFILLLCTWATSISAAVVSYSWLANSNPGSEYPVEEAEKWERGYFISAFIAFFFLPLVIMIVLYTRMFVTISRARKRTEFARVSSKKASIKPAATPEIHERRCRCQSYSSAAGDRLGIGFPNEANVDVGFRSKSTLSVQGGVLEGGTRCDSFHSAEMLAHSCQDSLSKLSISESMVHYNNSNGHRASRSFVRRLSDACGTAVARVSFRRHGEDRLGHARIVREHRVLIIFVTMLSVFVLCWCSWYIMLFRVVRFITVPEIVLDCLDILRFSVSFINPVLYTFLKTDFRVAFTRSFGCRDRQKAAVVTSGTNTPRRQSRSTSKAALQTKDCSWWVYPKKQSGSTSKGGL